MFQNIGLVGLGPMGCALAQNLIDKGFKINAWESNPDVRQRVEGSLGPTVMATSLSDMMATLPEPRCILLFLPSGQQVDETLHMLREQLSPGDIVADCGNSFYRDTDKRRQTLEGSGIHLIGVGVSGGPSGARTGPAIMAGGDKDAWKIIQPVFDAVAAKSSKEPCCGYFGEAGAGHFVKMVHNGIEYGAMQLLAELYGFLESGCAMDVEAIAANFEELNKGSTKGYLTQLTAQVVRTRSRPEGRALVHIVDDVMDQKGTGRWSVEAALEFGVAVPTITEAVMTRNFSANRSLRQEETSPRVEPGSTLNKPDTAQIELALTLALASTFAQGLTLFSATGNTFGKRLDRAAILRTWRQGCILSGRIIEDLIKAVEGNPAGQNILNGGTFPSAVEKGLPALRSLTAQAISAGVPMAGFASALAYVELLNGGVSSGRIIQLQRDYFGSHGLRDKETGATFHGPWQEGDKP